MKKPLALLGAALAATTLSACVTVPEVPERTQELDAEKMVAVATAARSAGVRIIWVNPPTKPVDR